jgi:predicted RNA-binding Zn-ribbon protein involved in translation (DUF1610 family)
VGKHVCPICEDVYAYRGELSLTTPVSTDAYEAWYCPECGYSFIATADAQQAFKSLVCLDAGREPTVSFLKIAEGPVVRRP